jgi:hypothetical protein
VASKYRGRYHLYYSPGKVYGVLIRVRGRLYTVGASTRGIFWRFGARVFCPCPGYAESIFGARYTIATRKHQPGLDLFLSLGMKDESIPIHIRPGRVCGSMHFSRTGLISFVITESDFTDRKIPDCNYAESEKSIAHIQDAKEQFGLDSAEVRKILNIAREEKW